MRILSKKFWKILKIFKKKIYSIGYSKPKIEILGCATVRL